MTIKEYQEQAARTINKNLNPAEMERHALFGLCSEVGEIHAIYQKTYQGHDFSEESLRKEIGDVAWMLAELCTVNGFDMEQVFKENIAKLLKRYPEGFDPEKSVYRRADDDRSDLALLVGAAHGRTTSRMRTMRPPPDAGTAERKGEWNGQKRSHHRAENVHGERRNADLTRGLPVLPALLCR